MGEIKKKIVQHSVYSAPTSKSLKDPARVALGSRIRKCREALRLTQLAAADLMEVERTSLNRWENGHEMPSLKAMGKLQKHLRVPGDLEQAAEEPQEQLMLPFDFEPFSLALRISPQRETVHFEVHLKKLGS
jgi:transcriptional regulator with XRE-family HTH domain